jgi:hypothetical protein
MLYDFNYHTEWLTGEMGEMGEDGEPVEEFVHENDDLTWDQVANASGVNEPIVNTRASIRAERAKELAAAASSNRASIIQEVFVEDVVGIEEEDDDDDDNWLEDDPNYYGEEELYDDVDE